MQSLLTQFLTFTELPAIVSVNFQPVSWKSLATERDGKQSLQLDFGGKARACLLSLCVTLL